VIEFVHRAENLLLAAVLALLMLLGVGSASTAFANTDELIRHLTLLVGMLGGMAAVRLPMLGVADSLNVSVTAAVLFYEAIRQRRAATLRLVAAEPRPLAELDAEAVAALARDGLVRVEGELVALPA